jgi:branched-chain amino acid transport system permease protein
LPPLRMAYLLHILILIGIYVILAESLNLIAGYAGLLSIAHAAFYGVGAYVAALLALRFAAPVWLTLPAALAAAAVLGVVVAWPGLRVRDDYFVIATFAFQIIVFSVMNNWVALTGGPLGLPGIPRPELFGWVVNEHWEFLVVVAVVAGLTVFVSWRLVRSPFGRVLRAIREDEVFAAAVGKNVAWFKTTVFMVGGAMAAVGGCLYAYYITFIDPTSFTVMESIFIISIVIVGGAGSLRGAALGAVVLVVLPEALRFVGLPNAVAANLRQIFYGLLLILFMMFRPQGLIGEFGFRRK